MALNSYLSCFVTDSFEEPNSSIIFFVKIVCMLRCFFLSQSGYHFRGTHLNCHFVFSIDNSTCRYFRLYPLMPLLGSAYYWANEHPKPDYSTFYLWLSYCNYLWCECFFQAIHLTSPMNLLIYASSNDSCFLYSSSRVPTAFVSTLTPFSVRKWVVFCSRFELNSLNLINYYN